MSESFIVVGLGYGDEGKGTVVDFLAREYDAHTVVRFNGGAQAAHNVVTNSGKHHTFAQFGSGTLAGVPTHLSRFMLVNPFDFWLEAGHLQDIGIADPWAMVTISPDALVTTPLHIVANQIREESRGTKHGTCGKGIGETQETADILGDAALRVGDLRMQGIVESKLEQLSNHYTTKLLETFSEEHGPINKMARDYKTFSKKITTRDDAYIQDLLITQHTLIFEGAQGILLDQDVGFHPHTTWSRTTSHNAMQLAIGDNRPTVIGVTRPYMTRHGLGPILSNDFAPDNPAEHNVSGGWQGDFRYGSWDALALDYASKCDDIDAVAVTCLDHLGPDWNSVWSYDYVGDLPDLKPYFWTEDKRIFQINPGDGGRAHTEAITTRLRACTCNVNHHQNVNTSYVADAIGEVLHAPVTLLSFGPAAGDKNIRKLMWTGARG